MFIIGFLGATDLPIFMDHWSLKIAKSATTSFFISWQIGWVGCCSCRMCIITWSLKIADTAGSLSARRGEVLAGDAMTCVSNRLVVCSVLQLRMLALSFISIKMSFLGRPVVQMYRRRCPGIWFLNEYEFGSSRNPRSEPLIWIFFKI